MNLAKDGDQGAQLNVGYLYDQGLGVKKNEAKALYWYRRAYRRRYAPAANNIGTVFRDRGQRGRAVRWFLRAAQLGDDGGLLMAAKIFLEDGVHTQRALQYLRTVSKSHSVCEAETEEAMQLLKQARRGK